MEVEFPTTSGCQLAPDVSSSSTVWPAAKMEPSATVTDDESFVASAERSCMYAVWYAVTPLQRVSPSGLTQRPGPTTMIGVESLGASTSWLFVVMVLRGLTRMVLPAPAPRRTMPFVMAT